MTRLFALAALGFAACTSVASPSRGLASLRIYVTPENARVYIDERFFGTGAVLSQAPKPLPAGTHRVSVEADGYFPHDVELELPKGETRIELRLRAIPD
jgi:hypothetical protein